MGEQDVKRVADDRALRHFMKTLLQDVRALELLLDTDKFETGIRRIGAEQEMFLVDNCLRPAPVATDILENVDDPRLTTELARFNLEANLTPLIYGGGCLRSLERELTEVLEMVQEAASAWHANVLLTGILPTLRMKHLDLDNMTPNPRYFELNQAMKRLRGGAFHIDIKGIDALETVHDTVMLESCNTSFQIHFQVAPSEFARLYNMAQAVTGPVMAAAVYSPVLLGRRLWNETRVALFQNSVDDRSSAHQARGHRQRVSFGDHWIRESVLEIYKEDIARFRVLIAADMDEDPVALVEAGIAPQLKALRLHNGTVYRWNRACYGVAGGKAHLRIENRILPAGPTVLDELANAAFFFGTLTALAETYQDISKVMDFDDAKGNFLAAARHGLKAQFAWIGGEHYTASSLILDRLLPDAREALKNRGIDSSDIDRYLGTLEERVRCSQTGSQWALSSLAQMGEKGTNEIRHRALAAAMLSGQRSGQPVHRWELADLQGNEDWRPSYETVGQFMTTDLFTVRPGDLVDLVASLMDWRQLEHIPVEDDEGRLVGLVSQRAILRLVGQGMRSVDGEPVAVSDIMNPAPATTTPDTATLKAMRQMRRNQIGCLPVIEGERLVGVVTERDFNEVTARLLEEQLSE